MGRFSRKNGEFLSPPITSTVSNCAGVRHALSLSLALCFVWSTQRKIPNVEYPPLDPVFPIKASPADIYEISPIIVFALANAIGIYGSKVLAVDSGWENCPGPFAFIRW